MNIKLLEIRDRGTMIIALCVDMNPDNAYQRVALGRYGYPCDGEPNIMLTHVNGGKIADNDPYGWKDRTYAVAHLYITKYWNIIKEGDVVDVEFIMKEAEQAKTSELIHGTTDRSEV